MGLSLVIGMVMAEVLQRLGAADVRVKWPNDLYLNDRKLAGITVELTGKTGDAAQLVIGAGISTAMRDTNASAITGAGLTYRKREFRSIVMSWLQPCSMSCVSR